MTEGKKESDPPMIRWEAAPSGRITHDTKNSPQEAVNGYPE